MDVDSITSQKREGGHARKAVTFLKEDDNSAQLLRKTTELDSATSVAVAAAAYAVHCLDAENGDIRNEKTLIKEISRKGDGQLFPFPRIKSSTKDTEATHTSKDGMSGQGSTRKPSSEPTLTHKPSQMPSSSSKLSTEAKIDSWERNEIEKIKTRHAKNRSRIQSWDDDKKTKAKIKLQQTKNELECKKLRNLQEYKFKLELKDGIGKCARAEMDKKMTREEAAVKKRAEKIRSSRGCSYFICF